jgi:mannose-6-phosphate isomerase-like protein (cupin superfamily)
MQKVTVDEIEAIPHFMDANTDRRPLAREIEAMGFAATVFDLAPSEAFSGGLHTHDDQEELFYVVEGTATFEIRAEPDADSEHVEVSACEAIHFEAGDAYQTGVNESDASLWGIAIGVPGNRHRWEGVEAVLACEGADATRPTVSSLPTRGPGCPKPGRWSSPAPSAAGRPENAARRTSAENGERRTRDEGRKQGTGNGRRGPGNGEGTLAIRRREPTPSRRSRRRRPTGGVARPVPIA